MKSRSKIKKIKKQPASSHSKTRFFSLMASIFILIAAASLCFDSTMRMIRLCFYGDGTERLKCDFNLDGVNAKWGYACWEGLNTTSEKRFGFSYVKSVNELIRQPTLNHNIEGGPLNINGNTFIQGVGGHAPSKIAFDLQGKYNEFSCKVGLDKSSGYNHGVIFTLMADGKEIYKSPKLNSDADPFLINCSVTGVKELVLFADNMRFDEVVSNVDWVDLKFEPQIHH